MKTFKTILITLFVTLSFIACKKDEDGQWIQYYKNKTGVGYVFYKWDNDSVAPIPNLKMRIESYTRGSGMLFSGNSHFDYVYTNNDGKYEFKLVKKIDEKNVVSYFIEDVDFCYPIIIASSGNVSIYCSDPEFENNKITLDTIFWYPDRIL